MISTLDKNWLTDSPVDFEYKKYTLLAYLQHCKKNFGENKLYPPLGDLLFHYRSITDLRQGVEQMQQSFPKEFSGIDWKKLQLQYEQQLNDESLHSITELVEFALPSIKNAIEDGRMIYDFVEKHIEVTPVGIVPVYNSEGYMMLHEDSHQDVHIYQFQYSTIQAGADKMRSLTLNYLYKDVRSIANNFENMKLSLISRFKQLPQPATYLCVAKIPIPFFETFVPIAKRVMVMRVL
ncbi:MAG: hypothetical protein ACKVOR_02990 [Flavobacteriales bacterium]